MSGGQAAPLLDLCPATASISAVPGYGAASPSDADFDLPFRQDRVRARGRVAFEPIEGPVVGLPMTRDATGSVPSFCCSKPPHPRARWGMSDRRPASPRSVSRNGRRDFLPLPDPTPLGLPSGDPRAPPFLAHQDSRSRPPSTTVSALRVRADRPPSCRQPSRPR